MGLQSHARSSYFHRENHDNKMKLQHNKHQQTLPSTEAIHPKIRQGLKESNPLINCSKNAPYPKPTKSSNQFTTWVRHALRTVHFLQVFDMAGVQGRRREGEQDRARQNMKSKRETDKIDIKARRPTDYKKERPHAINWNLRLLLSEHWVVKGFFFCLRQKCAVSMCSV